MHVRQLFGNELILSLPHFKVSRQFTSCDFLTATLTEHVGHVIEQWTHKVLNGRRHWGTVHTPIPQKSNKHCITAKTSGQTPTSQVVLRLTLSKSPYNWGWRISKLVRDYLRVRLTSRLYFSLKN